MMRTTNLPRPDDGRFDREMGHSDAPFQAPLQAGPDRDMIATRRPVRPGDWMTRRTAADPPIIGGARGCSRAVSRRPCADGVRVKRPPAGSGSRGVEVVLLLVAVRSLDTLAALRRG